MSADVDVAALDAALRSVLMDLANRPLNGALVLAYWLVMTNMLTSVYGVSEEAITALYPTARGLKVQVADARAVLN